MRFFESLVSVIAVAAPFASALNHDKVRPIPQKTAGGRNGDLIMRFKPWLKVETGCVPFPAVQSDGQVSGGLNPSGRMNGKCSKSEGQVYARVQDYNGMFAIMYAWYFPKDQNADFSSAAGAHKHDWENVVVWLASANNPTIKGISYSTHGGYEKHYGRNGAHWDGNRPKVAYSGPGNHHCKATGTRGGQQPLISWGSIPGPAKHSLNTYNFGKANVPLSDSRFQESLRRAKL